MRVVEVRCINIKVRGWKLNNKIIFVSKLTQKILIPTIIISTVQNENSTEIVIYLYGDNCC